MAEPFGFINPSPTAAPEAGSSSAAPAATTESTNAKMLNQVMGKLLDAGASSSAAVLTALTSIASAITASLIGGTTGTTANRLLRSKGTGARALQNTVISCDDSGNLGGILAISASGTITADVGAFATTLTKGGVNVAIVNQAIGIWSGTWKFTEDETVYVALRFPFAVTITKTDTITNAGTATVTVLIDSTPLGGSSNSASTSVDSQAHSSANVVGTNSSVRVTFASTSSDCENLCLTIWGTRVLAAS